MVDKQMIPIFGVTDGVIDLYKDFKSLYPYGKYHLVIAILDGEPNLVVYVLGCLISVS